MYLMYITKTHLLIPVIKNFHEIKSTMSVVIALNTSLRDLCWHIFGKWGLLQKSFKKKFLKNQS